MGQNERLYHIVLSTKCTIRGEACCSFANVFVLPSMVDVSDLSFESFPASAASSMSSTNFLWHDVGVKVHEVHVKYGRLASQLSNGKWLCDAWRLLGRDSGTGIIGLSGSLATC